MTATDRDIVTCGCTDHRGRACEVRSGSRLAQAAHGTDRQARRNQHTLVLLADNETPSADGPWPRRGRR